MNHKTIVNAALADIFEACLAAIDGLEFEHADLSVRQTKLAKSYQCDVYERVERYLTRIVRGA